MFAQLTSAQPVVPSGADAAVFSRLPRLLDESASEETPGQCEKRLTSLELIKGTTGIRRGVLQSLEVVDVLPNRIVECAPDLWTDTEDMLNGEMLLNNTRGRSDMEMPWSGSDWERPE